MAVVENISHDPNIVIMSTPPVARSVCESKHLACSRYLDKRASSKSLQVVQDLCECIEDHQKECKESLGEILNQLWGQAHERSISYRDELDSVFKRILEDNDGLYQGRQKLIELMENFQDEALH